MIRITTEVDTTLHIVDIKLRRVYGSFYLIFFILKCRAYTTECNWMWLLDHSLLQWKHLIGHISNLVKYKWISQLLRLSKFEHMLLQIHAINVRANCNENENELTCNPKRYQHEPTTCPDITNIRRLITKLAHADSNMNPVADWLPPSNGTNLMMRGIYWRRTVTRK
jgi:hypothetical protein